MNSKKTLFILFFLFLFLFPLFSKTDVFAEVDNFQEIPREQINPDAGSKYLIKRFKEKVFMFFKFDLNSKIVYYQVLLDRRLGELAYIAENRNIAHIETTSSRYESTAGQLAQILIVNKNKEKLLEVKQKFKDHLLGLAKIQDSFLSSSAEWRFIENDINSLKLYSQQIDDY